MLRAAVRVAGGRRREAGHVRRGGADEERAGALSARRACAAVRDAFVGSGGTYRTVHATHGPIVRESLEALLLADGSRLEADAYVFACGPWLGEVFPEILGDAIRPTRQDVYYFGTPRGSPRYEPGRLPVWIDFGERIFYGIPDVHGRGFKIADDTRGDEVDPTTLDRTLGAQSLARAMRLLSERFPELANAPLVESRVCQYENSPDGHFLLGPHPQAANAWLAGGGSGHGYKLGPAVGEHVAALVLGEAEPIAMFRPGRAFRDDATESQLKSGEEKRPR